MQLYLRNACARNSNIEESVRYRPLYSRCAFTLAQTEAPFPAELYTNCVVLNFTLSIDKSFRLWIWILILICLHAAISTHTQPMQKAGRANRLMNYLSKYSSPNISFLIKLLISDKKLCSVCFNFVLCSHRYSAAPPNRSQCCPIKCVTN